MSGSSPIVDAAAARVRFVDLVFEPDFLTAARDDGGAVTLSRRERALVRALAAKPNRLLTREQLLAAVTADIGEASDRSVDMIVNRLRRKLRDPARSPRFIATQYGEGYVWIAEAQAVEARPGFLVIGPVHGAAGGAAARLLEALRAALSAEAAPGQTVALKPDWRPDPAAPGFRFSLEVSFLAEGGQPVAALVLRDEPFRQVVDSRRLPLPAAADAAGLAAEVTAAVWRRLAAGPAGGATPAEPPLDIRLQEAALLLGPAHDPWAENERRERLARADDPASQLRRAMTLYARRLGSPSPDDSDAAAWARADAEIEALVLPVLPAVEGDPILALAAARLLAPLGQGEHLDRAEALARSALEASAAFAAALPVLGQIRGWRGDLEGALARLDEARGLAVPGSEFEVYLLVLRWQMLSAGGDTAAAAAQAAELFRIKPEAERQLGLLALRPGAVPSADNRRRLAALDEAGARLLLNHQFHTAARRFRRREHRAGVMAGLVEALIGRFGPDIVPPEIRPAL